MTQDVAKSHLLLEIVGSDHEGMTLRAYLTDHLGISTRLLRREKKVGHIRLNNERVYLSTVVRAGDEVRFQMTEEPNHFDPVEMPLDVVYEDADLLVINKPPFLVVHPTKGTYEPTLANGITHYLFEQGDRTKIRFVNRLDRDTSGLMIVAKNPHVQARLSDQMAGDMYKKYYLALIEGNFPYDEGTIRLPIGKHHPDDIARAVVAGGKDSVTDFTVAKHLSDSTLVSVDLRTGRTHQIRVHFSHLKHPIIGDELYGSRMLDFGRQALHCHRLTLEHPRTGGRLELEADLPDDMAAFIAARKEGS